MPDCNLRTATQARDMTPGAGLRQGCMTLNQAGMIRPATGRIMAAEALSQVLRHFAATRPGAVSLEEQKLERAREMDRFLASVEQGAFRIARYHLRDEDDALDAVQDAMIRLVRNYAKRPSEEWRPLFFRILQNKVRDAQRRRAVRAKVLGFIPGSFRNEEDATDPLQQAPDSRTPDPGTQLALDGAMVELERALNDLPARQKEAFLLRTIEALSVAHTAQAMGCSEGSVKTHYSRAVHQLRKRLGEHWDVTDR